eukprot:6214053-Pleurochrysis_carterae.AAC.3
MRGNTCVGAGLACHEDADTQHWPAEKNRQTKQVRSISVPTCRLSTKDEAFSTATECSKSADPLRCESGADCIQKERASPRGHARSQARLCKCELRIVSSFACFARKSRHPPAPLIGSQSPSPVCGCGCV